MKRYLVEWVETVHYATEVHAENEDEALDAMRENCAGKEVSSELEDVLVTEVSEKEVA